MADNFSRLFPPSIARMQWPLTYEKDNRTRLRREELRPHVPDSRQQLVNFINENIYDGGREGNRYAENAATILDFPLGLGHGIYDTTRAAAEGRLSDSAISLAMALPPPPIKKLGKQAVKSIKDISRKPARTAVPVSLSPSDPAIINPGDALQAKNAGSGDGPFGTPFVKPRRNETAESEDINFVIPRNPGKRSSPWVAQYPPLERPLRKFQLDYPKAPSTHPDGRLLFDIEGRPLTAKHIAGRKWANEKDYAINADDIASIIRDDTDLTMTPLPRQDLIPGTIGHLAAYPDGKLAQIGFLGDLPSDQADVTIAHEFGHLLDLTAGKLSTKEIDDELTALYSAHSLGKVGPPYLLPEMRGYPRHVAPLEKAAEAFRIYATGPNTMKWMAPKTAAAIRTLNTHPFFSKVIQFNGAPFGVPAGAAATAAALGVMANSDEAAAAPGRQAPETPPRGGFKKANADRGLVSISRALSRGNSYAQPRKDEKLRDILETRMKLEHEPRHQRYGGPR